MTKKYQRPKFLDKIITQEAYEKWLHRKAVAHVRRDRNRGNNSAIAEEYKIAIMTIPVFVLYSFHDKEIKICCSEQKR